MNKKKTFSLLGSVGAVSFLSSPVSAHCPLCVGGAGAAAGVAALLGVKYGAIGVFIGAFAAAMSLWIPRLLRKKYIPYQDKILFVTFYVTTILPLMPFLKDYTSIFVSISGDYGSPLNTTYLIDLFTVGVLIGTVIMFISPWLSRQLTRIRKGKMIRFQGMIITFLALLIAAIIMQVVR